MSSMLISPAFDDYNQSLSSASVTLDSTTSRVDITFSIVDDAFFELAEVLSAVLSFAPGGGNSRVVLSPNLAQVNILDDDGMVFNILKVIHTSPFKLRVLTLLK